MANPTSNFGWQMPTNTDLVKDLPADFEVFGQAVDTSLMDLKGGTTGQVLSKASNTDMDFTWVTSDDANAIQNTIVDAKGDLISATGNDVPARLAVGNNGESLVADSSATTGLRWQGNYAAGKNKIINADFNIWQRGTSFSTDNSYTADRWLMTLSGATGSVSRQSFTAGQTDVPNNPAYFLRFAVTTGDNNCRIETHNEDVTTFAGQTVTISFWAKGTNPTGGSLQVNFIQNFGTGGSAAVTTTAGTLTLTTSWQRFTYTISVPSISGKTVGTNSFWQFDIRQPAADTGTGAWTLDLSNVQVEAGNVATAFQTATGTLQGELAACQRYYQRITGTGATNMRFGTGFVDTTTGIELTIPFPVQMRTRPTALETTGTAADYIIRHSAGTNTTCNVVPVYTQANEFAITVSAGAASGLTAGQAAALRVAAATAYLGWSAEL